MAETLDDRSAGSVNRKRLRHSITGFGEQPPFSPNPADGVRCRNKLRDGGRPGAVGRERPAMGRALHALGRFCARRPLIMIGAWVVFLALVFGATAKFGAETSNDLTLPGTGSQQVKDLLE